MEVIYTLNDRMYSVFFIINAFSLSFCVQAQKADSGSVLMKRSMLVKAGEALAPDAFLLVLDSENDSRGTLIISA